MRSPYKSVAEANTESDAVSKFANGKFFKTNPLHFDIFDGVCQIEAEVIQMCVEMYRGDVEVCGIIDASEADCMRDAVLSYKKWAKEVKGVTKPNIVAPATFDPSLKRACQLMDVEFRHVPVGHNVSVSKSLTSFFLLISEIVFM